MRRQLVLVASGPGHGAVSALELAVEMAQQGQEIDVCLLEDAVLCARRDDRTSARVALERALRAGVALHYLEDDLLARGFGPEDVHAEAQPLGHGELVELILKDDRTALGAF